VAEKYAKSLQGSISAQLRKAEFDQQSVAGSIQELHQLKEIAQKIGDNATAQKIQSMASAQIDMISTISPELGAAFRQFYNSLDRPEPEFVADAPEEE